MKATSFPTSHHFVEALRLSQVMAAWLLVATALHWARARELQAGQAVEDWRMEKPEVFLLVN